MVDFVQKYNLQLKKEIQSQYYHVEKLIIIVHITYKHGLNSKEKHIFILKEYHFYISDD
jgi:hypothetical protein